MAEMEPVIVVVEDESPIRRFLWATLSGGAVVPNRVCIKETARSAGG